MSSADAPSTIVRCLVAAAARSGSIHLAGEPVELDRRRGDRDRAGLGARELEQLIDQLVHPGRRLARHVDVAQLRSDSGPA